MSRKILIFFTIFLPLASIAMVFVNNSDHFTIEIPQFVISLFSLTFLLLLALFFLQSRENRRK